MVCFLACFVVDVSTHSHPKVAAINNRRKEFIRESFNTQPPEGGCPYKTRTWNICKQSFNTQPPEGGCKQKIK